MLSLSRDTLTQPETWGKVPVVVFYGLFFYSVRKLGSFVVLLLFFSIHPLYIPPSPSLLLRFLFPSLAKQIQWKEEGKFVVVATSDLDAATSLGKTGVDPLTT